jgi:hypothetical protein
MFNLTCRRKVAEDIVKYVFNKISDRGFCTIGDLIHNFNDDVSKQGLEPYNYDTNGLWCAMGWDNKESVRTQTSIHAPVSFSEKWCVIEFPDLQELILPPKEPDKDLVNHPDHYNHEGRKECWDEMIDLFGMYYTGIFDLLTAYKYFYRADTKDGNSREQDIAEMNNYLNHCSELIICGAKNLSNKYTSDSDMEIDKRQVSLLATRYIALKHKIERESIEVKTNEQR